jgi:hypothetical protein
MRTPETILKDICKEVKHEDPDRRYLALDKLSSLKEKNNKDIDVESLFDAIELAGKPFPKPVDDWDDPSFYLIDFVADYRSPVLIDGIVKHFSGFSSYAKQRAFDFLCEMDEEKSYSAFFDILQTGIENESVIIPTETLIERPGMAKRTVEMFYPYLKNNKYKQDLYQLLDFLHREDIFYQFKKEEIVPLLLNDYQASLQKYREYDSIYNPKHVHLSWKENYLEIRLNIELYLSLFVYYRTAETNSLLMEALAFQDPILRANASIGCIQLDIPVYPAVLENLATNIESAEMFHYGLLRIRKEHLSPLNEKQRFVAKSMLFYHLLYRTEEKAFATQIELVSSLDTENNYNQPVRYYLAKAEIHVGEEIAAWVGAFNLEAGEDSIFVWDGTYTEFETFDEHSIEEHKRIFLKKRQTEKELQENEIAFEDGNQKHHIVIKGSKLLVTSNGNTAEVALHEIRKVTIESRKGGLLGLGKTDHAVIYNKKNEEAALFPLKAANYGEFCMAIHEHTEHLQETPFLEYCEIG